MLFWNASPPADAGALEEVRENAPNEGMGAVWIMGCRAEVLRARDIRF